jgi:hypothetical protein
MPEPEDGEIRELRIELMKADIPNKDADTAYKQGLLNHEPWKLVLDGMAAGGAVPGAGAGLMASLIALLRCHASL